MGYLILVPPYGRLIALSTWPLPTHPTRHRPPQACAMRPSALPVLLLWSLSGGAVAFLSLPQPARLSSCSFSSLARARARQSTSSPPRSSVAALAAATTDSSSEWDVETDVVVIGSGIGGLSCAALLAYYGEDVRVYESHYHAGGCAHGFEIDGFHFDSGPSLWNGMDW